MSFTRPEETILTTGPLANHPLRVFVASFRDYLQSRPQPAAPDTVSVYIEATAALLRFLADEQRFEPSEPNEITGAHIKAWVAWMNRQGQARNTVSIRIRSARQFFNYAIAEGWTSEHPFADVKPPCKQHKNPDPFSDAEISAVLKACSGSTFRDLRDQAIIRLWLDTGARRGEIANLTFERVDLNRQRVVLAGKMATRTGERVARIGAKTAIALKRYIAARAKHTKADLPDFWLGKRGALGTSGFNQILRSRAKLAGVDKAFPHRFRHTFADRWLEDGGSIQGLQEAGGWTSLEMVRVYTQAKAHERAMKEHERLGIADKF